MKTKKILNLCTGILALIIAVLSLVNVVELLLNYGFEAYVSIIVQTVSVISMVLIAISLFRNKIGVIIGIAILINSVIYVNDFISFIGFIPMISFVYLLKAMTLAFIAIYAIVYNNEKYRSIKEKIEKLWYLPIVLSVLSLFLDILARRILDLNYLLNIAFIILLSISLINRKKGKDMDIKEKVDESVIEHLHKDEKLLIRSNRMTILPIAIIIAVIGFAIYAFHTGDGYETEYYAMFILLPTALVEGLFIWWVSRIELIVTNKRVFGRAAFGKRVDLPLDAISSVGMGMLNNISVSTASGSIRFALISNRDEIHNTLSSLLVGRQEAKAQAVQGNDNISGLKELKDLLDSGIITQEEFDAKKKQILGL